MSTQYRVSGTLNRGDLAEAIATRTGLEPEQVDDVIVNLIDVIKQAVVAGHDVILTNFATFGAMNVAARPAMNPQTGEHVIVPARRRAKIRPAERFHEVVNDGTPDVSLKKRRSGHAAVKKPVN